MGKQVSYGKLLRLAHQRAIDGKGGLAASIAKMCLDQQAELTPAELDLTYQILRKLIDKVEVQIRRHIADILAERADVPRDLLAFLTNDAVHVAYPIIVRSRQLSDADLLGLIARQSQGHAILVERSVDDETYQDLIVKRPDLPTDLARRLYIWVGEALRHHIARNFDIDSDLADDAVEEAVWAALDEDQNARSGEGAPWSEADALSPAERLRRRAGQLLRTLEREGKSAFISAAARETNLAETVLARVFTRDNPQTMAIACKALGMDSDRFIAVMQSFHDEASWASFTGNGGFDRACAYFDRIDPLGAATVIRHWRQAPPEESDRRN
jgi:uncharacterized protein (DUF2336 family)